LCNNFPHCKWFEPRGHIINLSVKYDYLGECSPKKDCLLWHSLTFRQPEWKSLSESSELWIISIISVISLQLLSWVVNELVMLLVVCQLTCDVVGYKDCKTWLLRFDASFVTQTVRWFIVSNISRFVYCLSVLLLSSISHL